jgi:hypothetical protein
MNSFKKRLQIKEKLFFFFPQKNKIIQTGRNICSFDLCFACFIHIKPLSDDSGCVRGGQNVG